LQVYSRKPFDVNVANSGDAMNAYRTRFWIESALSMLTGALAGLTLVWRDWIEATTGFSPDRGGGSFEWSIVAALATVSIASALLARRELHRIDPV
jgi:hypothetical protein